jgi:hypothetical protein
LQQFDRRFQNVLQGRQETPKALSIIAANQMFRITVSFRKLTSVSRKV